MQFFYHIAHKTEECVMNYEEITVRQIPPLKKRQTTMNFQ
jgi:hypothetical protein